MGANHLGIAFWLRKLYLFLLHIPCWLSFFHMMGHLCRLCLNVKERRRPYGNDELAVKINYVIFSIKKREGPARFGHESQELVQGCHKTIVILDFCSAYFSLQEHF